MKATVIQNNAGLDRAKNLRDVEALSQHHGRLRPRGAGSDDVVLYDLEGLTVGCTICYDLHFSERLVALAQGGAGVIVVPAGFALLTGKDPWSALRGGTWGRGRPTAWAS